MKVKAEVNKNLVAGILNFTGIFIMTVVILLMVPFTIPRIFGYHLYGVLSESMTPAYSVGGVVYVKKCDPAMIEVGDVVTFSLQSNEDVVMTHRVVDKNIEEKFFITRGDANNAADAEPVRFDRVLGTVRFYIPHAEALAEFFGSVSGKAFFFILFAVSLILWLIADLLKPSAGKDKKNRTPEKTWRIFARGAGIICIIAAGSYLSFVFSGYYRGNREYSDLNKTVIQKENKTESHFTAGDSLKKEDLQILKAVKNLQEENEDVIGWIMFDKLELSYPVMQCDNNTYYLNHTFSRKKNPAGSIFMEAANSPDFNDCHTILYGHNMKNLTMFGALRKYRKPEFYENNQYFTVYTADHIYRYQIFAYYDIEMDADLYTVGFRPDETFENFVDRMCRRSYLDTNVSADREDKVLTLSTCSTKGNRFVVNAKRID